MKRIVIAFLAVSAFVRPCLADPTGDDLLMHCGDGGDERLAGFCNALVAGVVYGVDIGYKAALGLNYDSPVKCITSEKMKFSVGDVAEKQMDDIDFLGITLDYIEKHPAERRLPYGVLVWRAMSEVATCKK